MVFYGTPSEFLLASVCTITAISLRTLLFQVAPIMAFSLRTLLFQVTHTATNNISVTVCAYRDSVALQGTLLYDHGDLMATPQRSF